MERRPLSDRRAEVVRENALATYLGLVAAVNGSSVTQSHGFTLVRGPGPFSFCNFAAGFDVPDDAVEGALAELGRQVDDCPGLFVFEMTGDRPASLFDRLPEHGFERRQTLVSLFSDDQPEPTDAGAVGVDSASDRRAVADFMARQFFWSMPSEAREGIAAATAASGHAIWSVGPAQRPEGAVMLVDSPGAVGLFNLCVRPELRSRGLGSKLVRAVQTVASARSKPVVLQCAPDLASWYEGLGFEPVGKIVAHALAFDGGGDILD